MKQFYVYAHKHPVTKEPFYIGKGTQDRAYERRDRSERWRDIVNKLKAEGLIYSVEILHICDSEDVALALEKAEIAKYEHLTNIRENYTTVKASDAPSFEKDLKYLGRQIRDARSSQDIRAFDLAKALGISRATLAKIEEGKGLNSELGIVLKILHKLGLQARLPL
ncbi:MAG: helix-turn-helix domain-containing protein [Candidatus Methanoperedens sp.]|nr:helix-turn-helix domain-containing protein [Candidatus Methanoperedens sp.]